MNHGMVFNFFDNLIEKDDGSFMSGTKSFPFSPLLMILYENNIVTQHPLERAKIQFGNLPPKKREAREAREEEKRSTQIMHKAHNKAMPPQCSIKKRGMYLCTTTELR